MNKKSQSSEYFEKCEAIVSAYKRLDCIGLNRGASGNISMKTNNGFLITPTGLNVEKVRANNIVELNFEGEGINEIGVVSSVTGEAGDYVNQGEIIVRVDPRYFRPTEVNTLLGNARKAKKILKWKPKITFNQMVKEMVESDYKEQKKLIS